MGTLTFLDATEQILSENRKDMRVSDVVQEIIDKKLVETESSTPQNTLYSAIYQENKRRDISGEKKRFTLSKGRVGLTAWLKDGIEGQIQKQNESAKKSLLEKIQSMHAKDVESLVALLFVKMGFDAETTRFVKDGGVDIRGELVTAGVIRMPIAIQVKRLQSAVSSDDIQKLRGALDQNKDEHGVFVTTGTFSKPAEDEAKVSNRAAIDLIDGKQLVNLLVEYKIGVKEHIVFEPTDFTLAKLEEDVTE
jgi:restriction system protein